MTVHYPNLSSIQARHRVLLVTLGGGSASSGSDPVMTLADTWTETSSSMYCDEVLGVTGKESAPLQSNVKQVWGSLRPVIEKMKSVSLHEPVVVFVGKSLGGALLHKVTRLMHPAGYGVRLFIGVDMSWWVGRHWQDYQRTKNTRHARTFVSNVQDLINFFQRKDLAQTGHPARRWGESGLSQQVNIHVNRRKIAVDAGGNLVVGSTRLCEDVNHFQIDSCPRLLTVIKQVIQRRVI